MTTTTEERVEIDRGLRGRQLMLHLRIVSVVSLVFVVGMALFAVLNYLKFERLYLQEARLRYDSVAWQVSDTVSRSLGGGLALEAAHSAEVAMQRMADWHAGRLSLHLRNLDGAVLVSSQGHAPAAELPPLPDDSSMIEEPVRQTGTDVFFTTVPIRADGETVGALTVGFGSAEQASQVSQLGDKVVQTSALIVLATLPFLAVVLILLVVLSERRVRVVAQRWRDVVDRERDVTDADIEVDPALRHVRKIAGEIEARRNPDRTTPCDLP